MKKNFNTLNEEVSRIKELLNVTNITEQKSIDYYSPFKDKNSMIIYSQFITDYLPKFVEINENMKLSQYLINLKNFRSSDKKINDTNPIDFFRNTLNYKKQDPNIKIFQKELGPDKITSLSSTNAPFVDGDFGVGTVRASLDIRIEQITQQIKSGGDRLLGVMGKAKTNPKSFIDKTFITEPTKTQEKNINKTQELNIGTQSTH